MDGRSHLGYKQYASVVFDTARAESDPASSGGSVAEMPAPVQVVVEAAGASWLFQPLTVPARCFMTDWLSTSVCWCGSSLIVPTPMARRLMRAIRQAGWRVVTR